MRADRRVREDHRFAEAERTLLSTPSSVSNRTLPAAGSTSAGGRGRFLEGIGTSSAAGRSAKRIARDGPRWRGCRTRPGSWRKSNDCRRGYRAVPLSSDLRAGEPAEQSETSIAGTWCWQKEAVP